MLNKIGGHKVAFFVFGVILHNFLEGLALGVQTNKSSAVSLFIAIMLHSLPLATAVTTALLKQLMLLPSSPISMPRMFTCLLIMSIIRPVGLLLGLAVVLIHGLTTLIVAAFLQSFASGVFLYITFMSLLPAEFSSRETERPQHQHNLKTTAVAGAGTSNKFEAISEDTKINGQKHLQMTWKVFAFTCGWALMSLL